MGKWHPMSCLLYSNVNQLQACTCPLSTSFPTPDPSLSVIALHRRAPMPGKRCISCSALSMAVHIGHCSSVHPLCLVTLILCSHSLFWWIHPYHFSRFHLYMLINNAAFSLSDFPHSVQQGLFVFFQSSFLDVSRIHIPSWKCSDFLWRVGQLHRWTEIPCHQSWTPRGSNISSPHAERSASLWVCAGEPEGSQDSSVHVKILFLTKSEANEAGKKRVGWRLAPSSVGFRSNYCSHAMVPVLLTSVP